jgi:CubicO group peptidase (beta-lactamase class C family)
VHSAPAGDVPQEQVAAAVAQLDTLAQQALVRTGVPGLAVAVVYRDEVVYLKGFGVREAGKPAAVDADTVFQLASVSKPIASTVVAALVGEGVVDWDDRIVDHDPGFAMYDPWVTSQITLRDMFAHRSGLPGWAGDLLEDIGYDRAEVLHRLRFQPPASSFRSTYAYTNFGLTEGAVTAARAAGTSWENAAAERLYEPLGMRSTSSRFADYQAASNRAVTHVLVDGAYVPKYVRNADAQSPAGGVSSTVRDMAQWLRLQLGEGTVDGKQIVGAEALAETHRPQIVNRPPADPSADRASFYGLGWNVSYDDAGRVRLGHSGGFNLGAATVVNLIPAEALGIVVLTNAAPRGVPEAVAQSFLDLATTGRLDRDYLPLYEAGFAREFAPNYGTTTDYTRPPVRPSPPLAFESYAGAYRNDYYGEIEIAADVGGLVLHMGPKKAPYPMWHWNRDVFLYQPTGENAYGPSAVTFVVGAEQKATRVVIENLDIHGEGGFERVAPSR